ncbi:MAG: T9SS type A sorting domain-containing protein [Bacteroidetes bacterium]|nr:T9SS type A sorting domain-containing protein [Bacteroidota bacterium]
MKKYLLKKISACLPVGMAFILTAMLFSASANAQIVYTDVIPDSTMNCIGNGLSCTQNYDLDLNNDAISDFILTAFHVNPPQIGNETISRVNTSPLNGNAVKDTLVNSDTVSIPIQLNAVINSNLLLNQSWQTSGSQILKNGAYGGGLSNDTVWGLWDSLSDYYLGLRLLLSGQIHYGWVRLRVDVTESYASLIVKNYAYNTVPNQAILAGQTVATGINENSFASSINIFPNPAKDKLTIALGSNNKKVEITIADMTGKVIYSKTASDPDSYQEQKIEVTTQDFATGIYVVQIQTGEFLATKRLVVEK